MTSKIPEWRIAAAAKPPEWTGDLNDDCTANWAGFTLRAEWMNKELWWWAVYDGETSEHLTSSNDIPEKFRSGEIARTAAEDAARKILGLPSRQ